MHQTVIPDFIQSVIPEIAKAIIRDQSRLKPLLHDLADLLFAVFENVAVRMGQ